MAVMVLSSVMWSATPQSLNNPDGTNPYSPYEGHAIATKPVPPLLSSLGNENSDAEWSATQMELVFKFVRQRDEAIAGIRKADETIAKARNLISRAQAADNKAAEMIATRALQTAQESKRRYEQKKIQSEKNSAYIRNRMADKSGMNMKIAGMVTQHTGRVQVTSGKSPYDTIPLDGDQAGYFEEEDTISTYDNSSAEIECFDGRGTLKIGEYSSVKMEKKDATTEALSLIKGKIHIAVEKAEAVESWLENQATTAAKELRKIIARSEHFRKKFEVRTPSGSGAVRSTTFTVTINDTGATVFEMLEGNLDVTNLKTSAVTSIKGGEKITINPDGSSIIEASRIEPSREWWEK